MKNLIKTIIFSVIFLSNIFTLYSQTRFNDALAKAKSEDKRVIIDIYTDWCGWCKKMDEDVYSNKKIKKIIEESFVFIKLDAESNDKVMYNGKSVSLSDLASQFNAVGYPSTVFLEPDGKLIEIKYDNSIMKNIPGYYPAKEFKKILEFIRDGKYKDEDLSKTI